jgi:hypothetical protein
MAPDRVLRDELLVLIIVVLLQSGKAADSPEPSRVARPLAHRAATLLSQATTCALRLSAPWLVLRTDKILARQLYPRKPSKAAAPAKPAPDTGASAAASTPRRRPTSSNQAHTATEKAVIADWCGIFSEAGGFALNNDF